jgi:DnaJ-class molecular chaperone
VQLIQRRCEVCEGSGLVMRGSYPKKCTACGGFFPWISWQMFLSANAQPGNGGKQQKLQ